jgi:signal transduction histidine kinase
MGGWWRARPWALDVALAALMLAIDVASGVGVAARAELAGYLVASVVLTVPVAVRRWVPRTAAAVVLAGGAFAVLTHPALAPNHFGLFAAAVLVVTLRVQRGGRDTQVYLAAIVAGAAAWTWVSGNPWIWLYLIWMAVAAVVGELLAAAAARRAAQDRDRELVVAQERARIAREMHDVVTHAVSVMVVHAEGARLAVRRDPERAEQAMGTIADAGRQTLDELRGLIAALRGADPDPTGGSTGELTGLVATMRAAGLPVRLEPERAQLPAGLRATGYRIVQEALTNCLRHAPGAAATVRVRDGAGELRIEVLDDGVPAGQPPRPNAAGAGLLGMRERARSVGGHLEAGPRESGGWRVLAVLPRR